MGRLAAKDGIGRFEGPANCLTSGHLGASIRGVAGASRLSPTAYAVMSLNAIADFHEFGLLGVLVDNA